METNFISLLLAALSTVVIGFVWYHPKIFGTIWMKESGMTQEKMKRGNMLLIFCISIVYAFFISLILQSLVIHQLSALSMTGGDASKALPSYAAFMADHGHAFRTFKHGALHGFLAGLFLALPVIGTNALYERQSFKYILVNGGFWIVCFAIMGGIICALK